MATPVLAETTITINAPIEKVWAIMTDTANYPAWNPFVFKAEATGNVTQPGNKMLLFVRWQNGKQDSSHEIITDTQAPHTGADGVKKAYWSYRFTGKLAAWGLVMAVRCQWLQQNADGTTTYSTKEEFNGLLKAFIPLANVQNGFERQALALKNVCEKL